MAMFAISTLQSTSVNDLYSFLISSLNYLMMSGSQRMLVVSRDLKNKKFMEENLEENVHRIIGNVGQIGRGYCNSIPP